MVHEITLLKLKPDTSLETVESLIVETRIRLLKVPEVLNLSCGKAINHDDHPYQIFIAMDFENMAKRNHARNSAIFIKYDTQWLQPHTTKQEVMLFEMEPGKDVAYS